MKHATFTRSAWLVASCAVIAAMFAAACNDTAKQTTHVRPPASAPAPVVAQKPPAESLPVEAAPASFASLRLLQPGPRPAIDVLLEQAQAGFDAGQKAYAAADYEKARENYDRAVELIFSSGFTPDFDPRLSDLFDRLGDALEAHELEAQKTTEEEEGEAPSTPAPIDELADLTLPPGDPRLAAKANNELMRVPHDLPLAVNDSVLQYLSFFTTTKGRGVVERGLERRGRYETMIRQVLREEGVPEDLIYLAQAESAFLPEAVSRAGARGIWQFMPFRGRQYGLDRTYYIDERSDPEKATHAAAQHMRDLYDMFGDWYLVMAAYNSGPGNVVKAVQRTGYADFWEIQRRNALPKQTRNYVPIIIALALVAKDPAAYGVQVAPEKPPQFDTVTPGHAIDLRLVSDATGADLDDLRLLNPALLRTVTPNDPHFELRLPTGTAAHFDGAIRQVPPEKWTSWRLHPVAPGETLAEIARRYRVTLSALEAANHLPPRATVSEGFVLNVPTAPPAVRLVSYRVQRGDTLEGIAERFDVTVAELKRWNHLSGEHVPRGVRLRIYAGASPAATAPRAKTKSAQNSGAGVQNVSAPAPAKPAAAPPAQHPVQHRVKPGETLYQIARAYRTTVEALKESNPFLAQRGLEAGDLLRISR